MKLFNYKIQIVALVGLCILDMSGVAYLVQWRESFWSAVSGQDYHSFLILIGIFSAVALTLCLISGLETYVQNKLALNWRRVLTRKALRLERLTEHEGHGQRVQEDCRDYPLLIIDLLRFFGMQGVMMVYYLVVIISHVGLLYAAIPLVYSALSTGISYYVAFPLIQLNYINQVLEAAFRQSLKRIDYAKVHRNNHKMFRKSKHLQYFQYFYNQILVIFPYLILAPLYFSGKLVFGSFMQVASTISHLTEALGSIVGNFDRINKFISCRRRLKEMHVL